MIKTRKQLQPHINAKGLIRSSEREKTLAEALRKNLKRRRKKTLMVT